MDTDERKYMTDKEILDKYINLRDSCLTEQERLASYGNAI